MRALAAIGLLLLAGPAVADTTAVYSGASSPITVEVAADGDARVTAGPNGAYLLSKGGDVFFIAPDPAGRGRVFRVADFIAARREMAESLLKQHPGLQPRLELGEQAEVEHDALVPGGEVTVNGRVGTAYFPAGGAGAPILVISQDPQLASLQKPMIMSEEFAEGMARAQVFYDPIVDRLVEALKVGTPLKLLDSELTEIRWTPIPPSRFQLPSQPETRDQIRRELEVQPRG